MASSFKSPILQAIDQNGDPVPGAKLFVFASGTTTPIAVFSDEALTVALPNPIIANARGYFSSAGGIVQNIFWDVQALRLRLTDANDSVIWEIDNYTSPAGAGDVIAAADQIITGVHSHVNGLVTGDVLRGLTEADVAVRTIPATAEAIITSDGGRSKAWRRFTPSAETNAYTSAMSVAPSLSRVYAIDRLVSRLTTHPTLWDKLGWVNIWAHDEQAFRLNLRNPSSAAVLNGGGVFEADRGYRFNGSDGYLDTGFNFTDEPTWEQDNAHLGVWIEDDDPNGPATEAGVVGYRTGGDGAVWLSPWRNTRLARLRLNSDDDWANADLPVNTGTGYTVGSRLTSGEVELFRDGQSLGVFAQDSTGVENNTLAVGRILGGDLVPQWSAALHGPVTAGSGLTRSEASYLYAALLEYRSSLRAPVEVLMDGSGALFFESIDLLESVSVRQALKADITVTVGAGGDFATINDALLFADQYRTGAVRTTPRAKFVKGGAAPRILVRLLSGFVMQEQVFVEAVDFGHVSIVSEDPKVTINRLSLTQPTSVDGRENSNPFYPAFYVAGGTLPVIGCLFEMDESGSAFEDYESRSGIIGDNASMTVLPGCGVINAAGFGWQGYRGSRIIGNGAVFDGAKAFRKDGRFGDGTIDGVCVYLEQACRGNVRGISARNGGSNGLYFNISCIVDATGADASGQILRNGFYLNQNSIASFRNGVADDCGEYGAYIHRNSMANLRFVQINRAGLDNIRVRNGAHAFLEDFEATDAEQDNLSIDRGGKATIGGSCDLTGAGRHAIFVGNGGDVQGNMSGVDLSDAGSDGIHSVSLGTVSARGATINNPGSGRAIYSGGGSRVDFTGGETDDLIEVAEGGVVVALNLSGTPSYSQPPGLQNQSGLIVGQTDFTLATNTFTRVFIGNLARTVLITPTSVASGVYRGLLWVRPGQTLQDLTGASSDPDIVLTTGPLTGTTGGAGDFTLSVASDGFLYIENRQSARGFRVNVLG